MGCLLELEGIGREQAKEKAVQIFSFLDVNGDGRIELQEFLTGCLGDEDMVNILSHGPKPKKLKPRKVFHFTEDLTVKKDIKYPFENSISIFDEIKFLK